jgi:hypothetical protein
LKGRVLLAENGKVDSSMIVMLYKNAADSSVKKEKPDYITRVDGKGFFIFKNLPAGLFKIYALKDMDGNKFYSSKKEIFAFYENNRDVSINTTDSVVLYAYSEEKEKAVASSNEKKSSSKKMEYVTSLVNQKQDLLEPLVFSFPVILKNIK